MAHWRAKLLQVDDENEFPSLGSVSRALPKPEMPDFDTADDMVTFKIGMGSTLKKFIIHKEVACKASPVLNAAFNSSFIEGQTGIYCLDDAPEDAFRLLTQWMYNRQVKFHRGMYAEDIIDEISRRRYTEDLTLIRLWCLADKLCMGELQNYVVDGLVGRGVVSNFDAWAYAYENTAFQSPLRSLLVTQLAWGPSEFCTFDYNLIEMPRDMLCDMLRVFREALPEQRRFKNARNIFAEDYYVAEDVAEN